MRLLALLAFVWTAPVDAGQQAVTVKGVVNCRGKPQPGTFVQLYEEDSVFIFSIFDDDDLLGAVVADHHGIFCVKGTTSETSTIEPFIKIEHNCGYEGLDKKHVFKHMVPEGFIAEGNKSTHIYHMGDIELLTEDAPVQAYSKQVDAMGTVDERIRLCLPTYVQYKTFYEKAVITEEAHENTHVLPTDDFTDEDIPEVTNSEETREQKPAETSEHNEHHEHHEKHEHHEHHEHHETVVVEPRNEDQEEAHRQEQLILKQELEEKQREERRLEEERLREEEKRAQEIIHRAQEERRLLEEEQQKQREADRIRLEKEELERRQEDEKRRIEAEEFRESLRRIEEERKRIQTQREEERKRADELRQQEERERDEELRLLNERRRVQEEQYNAQMAEHYKEEESYKERVRQREELLKQRAEAEARRKEEELTKPRRDPCVQYPVPVSRNVKTRVFVEDPCLRR